MADGRLVRVKLAFERDYTQIPNEWLRSNQLSLRARGLLALLMSHRDGYVVSLRALAATNPDGEAALRTAVQELKDEGFLVMERRRGIHGKIAGVDWILTDPAQQKARSTPQLDFPHVDEPHVDKPRVDNHRLKEAHSEEHSYSGLSTNPSTGAGANEVGLPAGDLESRVVHTITPAQRYEQLIHQHCPMHPGQVHRYTGQGGTCCWCGILPTQVWVGKDIRYKADLEAELVSA